MSKARRYVKKVTILDSKSSPKARAERLKRLRNLANLSRKELCQLSGININTLIGWEVGRYGGLPADGAEKVIRYMSQKGVQCTLEWLLHELGSGPKAVTDYLIANDEDHLSQSKSLDVVSHTEKSILHELVYFRKQFPRAISLLVEDDGMMPYYHMGDYVAGIKYQPPQWQSLVGLNCIIQRENRELILRNFRAGSGKGLFNLICLNPQTTVSQPILYNEKILNAAP